MTALIPIVLLPLIVTVVAAAALRRVVRDESDVERRLRAPGTPTISYAVPNGGDPAHLRIALGRAGFASALSHSGTRECLLVECPETDRDRVRKVIEKVHESAYDGSELDLHPAVFEDERPQTG
jgi:hypothetical protein